MGKSLEMRVEVCPRENKETTFVYVRKCDMGCKVYECLNCKIKVHSFYFDLNNKN